MASCFPGSWLFHCNIHVHRPITIGFLSYTDLFFSDLERIDTPFISGHGLYLYGSYSPSHLSCSTITFLMQLQRQSPPFQSSPFLIFHVYHHPSFAILYYYNISPDLCFISFHAHDSDSLMIITHSPPFQTTASHPSSFGR